MYDLMRKAPLSSESPEYTKHSVLLLHSSPRLQGLREEKKGESPNIGTYHTDITFSMNEVPPPVIDTTSKRRGGVLKLSSLVAILYHDTYGI